VLKRDILNIQTNSNEDISNLYFEKEWSVGMRKFMVEERKELRKRSKGILLWVQRFVKLRNELLNAITKYRDLFEKSSSYMSSTKIDFVNVCDLVGLLKNTKYVKPNFLYDIPVKNHKNELYKDDELTEEEFE